MKLAVILFSVLICVHFASAQGSFGPIGPLGKVHWEETELQVTVSGVISSTVPSVVVLGNAYVSASDVLHLLKIRVDSTRDEGYLRGFYLHEDNRFVIDAHSGSAAINKKDIKLKFEQYILTDERLYLRTDVFDTVFGIHSRFNEHGMEVLMSTDIDLPIVMEIKRQKLYAQFRKGTELESYDVALPRKPAMIGGGMLDWAATWTGGFGIHPQYSYMITPAWQMIGGDAEVILNAESNPIVQNRGPQFRWHYADNDAQFLKQVTLGSGLGLNLPYAPSALNPVALQFTNHETVRRTSYGTYTIADTTTPGWMVELWINRRLADLTQADNLGRYTFKIPVTYGATEVWVKSYGPWGELHANRKYIQIPFSFLRPGEFEYSVSGAYTRLQVHEGFGVGMVSYGISDALTVNAGMSYAPKGDMRWTTPFTSLSARPFSGFLASAEYAYGVKSSVVASYSVPYAGSVNATWTKYETNPVQGTQAKEEFQASANAPLTGGVFKTTASVSGNLAMESGYTTSHLETAVSGVAYGYLMAASLVGDWFGASNDLQSVRTAVSFSTPSYFGIALRPTAEYDFISAMLTRSSVYMDLSLFGYNTVSLGAEYLGGNKSMTYLAAMRMDLPFSSTSVSIQRMGNIMSSTSSAHGTVGWDETSQDILVDNHGWAHTGGITFQAFLDMNNNGVRDSGEITVGHVDVRTSGGRLMESKGDSTTRITDLEPYRHYVVNVSPTGFENISWRPRYNSYNVVVEPNQFLCMQIPVIVAGEAIGSVRKKSESSSKGISGILVRFVDGDGKVVDSTFTMMDGTFDDLGLPPGKYTAVIDELQLKNLGLHVVGGTKSFLLRRTKDGDVVDNLDYVTEANDK